MIELNLSFLLVAGILVYVTALVEVVVMFKRTRGQYRLFLLLVMFMGGIYLFQNTLALFFSDNLVSPYPELWILFDYLVALVVFTSLSIIKILHKVKK